MSGADQSQKAAALDAILDAWDRALAKGVEPEMLASAAIYAALADMVDIYGIEPVAEFCAALPERVRVGEFTLRPDSREPEGSEGA